MRISSGLPEDVCEENRSFIVRTAGAALAAFLTDNNIELREFQILERHIEGGAIDYFALVDTDIPSSKMFKPPNLEIIT